MGNYVNGVGYPIIKVKSIATGLFVETIQLDLCMEGGLVEDYAEDRQSVQLQSGEIIHYDFKGSRISFTLDYSSYVQKANLFLIERIFFYASLPDSYQLFLTPRNDVSPRVFEVLMLDGVFSLGVQTGGVNTVGHKFPVIKFITKYLVGKNFLDPDEIYLALPIREII